jgi:hypothetical protein
MPPRCHRTAAEHIAAAGHQRHQWLGKGKITNRGQTRVRFTKPQ